MYSTAKNVWKTLLQKAVYEYIEEFPREERAFNGKLADLVDVSDLAYETMERCNLRFMEALQEINELEDQLIAGVPREFVKYFTFAVNELLDEREPQPDIYIACAINMVNILINNPLNGGARLLEDEKENYCNEVNSYSKLFSASRCRDIFDGMEIMTWMNTALKWKYIKGNMVVQAAQWIQDKYEGNAENVLPIHHYHYVKAILERRDIRLFPLTDIIMPYEHIKSDLLESIDPDFISNLNVRKGYLLTCIVRHTRRRDPDLIAKREEGDRPAAEDYALVHGQASTE